MRHVSLPWHMRLIFFFFFFFQANGYSFINIDHGQAVSLLKTFQNAVELIIVREVSS